MKHLHTYLFAAALALFLVPFSRADAKILFSVASVSPSSSAPNASVQISVTATLTTGSTAPNTWKSIGYRIATIDGAAYTCVNITPHTTSGTYTETITATAPATAGTYNLYITAHALEDCFNPYVAMVPSKSSALTVVAQTPVTLSSVSVADKVYDGTTSAGATTACTLAGSPAGVTCSGTGTFVDKNVGTNKQVAVTGITLSGPNASLYSLAVTTATTSASITKAPLTVTASNASRAYGEAEPVFTGTISGFVAGETITSANITGAALCTTAATLVTPVGAASIDCTPGTLAANNYSFTTFVPGTLTITQAGQSITFPPLVSATYGAQPQPLHATTTSNLAVSYESLTPQVCAVVGDAVEVSNVGTCTVRALQVGDGNYTSAAHVDQSFTVERASTVTTVSCPTSRAYTGSAQTPCTATVTGPHLSQSLDVVYTANTVAGEATAQAAYSGTDTYAASSGSATFTITPDSTAPRIAPHEDVVAEATSADGAHVVYTSPTASDTVDAAVAVSCLPVSGSVFRLGDTDVECSAVDASGNAAAPTRFTVSVRDTTPPVLALRGDASVAFITPTTFVDEGATWTDAVDGSGSLTSGDSVYGSRPGVYVLSYAYTDAAGNVSAPVLRTITVSDGEAPVFTDVPTSIQQEAVSAAGAPVTFSLPQATDAVDGEIVVACDHAPGKTFPLGATVITCEATDAAGHTAYASWQVTVVDTTPPVVTLVGDADVTVDAGVLYTDAGAMWTDAVDGTGTAQAEAAVDTARPGVYTYVYTYTDAARNAATPVTRTVTVVDKVAPVFSDMPEGMHVEAVGPSGSTVVYPLPHAHDAVDGDRDLVCLPASGNTFALGKTDVVCVSSDSANNEARSSFAVEVVDTTKPVVTLVGSTTQTLLVGDVYAELGASWSDAVDGAGTVEGRGDVDTARAGTYTRSYSYTDLAGNVSEVITRTIFVESRPVVTANVTSGGGGVAGTVYTFSHAPQQSASQQVVQSSSGEVTTLLSQSPVPTENTQTTVVPGNIQSLQLTSAPVPTLEQSPPDTAPLPASRARESFIASVQNDGDSAVDSVPSALSQGTVLGASTERVARETSAVTPPRGYTQVATTTVLYDFFMQNPLLLVLVLTSLAISGITGTALYRVFSEANVV